MLIIGIILVGLLAGAAGQWLVTGSYSWGTALVVGLIGSFVGGLLISLIAGDGLRLRPSGIIGSIVGAIVVSLIYRFVAGPRQGRRR